jgi:hypothetical protein
MLSSDVIRSGRTKILHTKRVVVAQLLPVPAQYWHTGKISSCCLKQMEGRSAVSRSVDPDRWPLDDDPSIVLSATRRHVAQDFAVAISSLCSENIERYPASRLIETRRFQNPPAASAS